MHISSLSDYDFVTLVANYNYLHDGHNQQVSRDVAGRGYSAAQLAQATNRITERFNPVTSCNLRFTKPFGHLKFEALSYILTLFENYERGCLPFSGPVTDQPAQIMEIFGVLKQLKFEFELKARMAAQQGSSR